MAAHSGGVDWASVIKPLLNSGSLSKNDLNNLTKTILKCENEILEHDSSFDVFYMSFAALAANNISGQCNALCQNQILQITEACGVLIRYILNKFERSTNSDTKLLLHALKSLCEGKSQDQDFDQIVFSSILRNAKYPEHKSNVAGSSEKESPKSEMKRSRSDLLTVILQQLSTSIGTANAANWNPLSEEVADCTQVFTSTNISFMQANNAGDIILKVCSSLPVLSRYYARYEESAVHGKPLHLPISHTDAAAIKAVLPQISSDISLLSLAISLPILEPLTPNKIKQLSKCAMAALYCAVLTSISSSVLTMTGTGSQKSSQQQQQQQSIGDCKVTSTTGLGSSCSSTSVAGSSTAKESDSEILSSEDHARNIVDKALEIFTAVETIFNTTRYHVYLNHLCMGAWLLINGMQGAMGASGNSSTKILIASALTQDEPKFTTKTPSSSSSTGGVTTAGAMTASITSMTTSRTNDIQSASSTTSGRVNLSKVQQGFGVLNAAIASHCLTLLNELIEDLKLESRAGDEDPNPDRIEPCGFDILGQYTSLQRIARVLNCATMQQLLTFLATVSYRKACSLKRINIKSEGDAVSFSDSTTYFNDSMSCSEYSDTEEEEDSESYLGTWFKETLSPEGKDEAAENSENKSMENQRNSTSMVPAKDEPHEYLELSAQIFSFLDTTLGSNHKYLNKYVKSGLSEQQMALLANILKDLDRDAARGEIESAYSTQWQNAMIEFSGAIGRYLHNLISGSLINESLQSSLLLHLGVSPWTQDTTVWPLQVYPRSLSVLVQILLLKPSQEKEAACLSVWHRLVNTLVEGVCSSSSFATAGTTAASVSAVGAATSTQTFQIDSTDYEDLNVEHAQLLLFLFHSLNLMQKKSILLLTAGGVIRCAEVCRTMTSEKPLRDHQIILLSRLLLFLEYLMKHLYNAPTPLLEQVRWNLFSTIVDDTNTNGSNSSSSSATAKQTGGGDAAGTGVSGGVGGSSTAAKSSKLMSFCRKDIEDKYRKYSHEYVSGVRPKFYSLSIIDPKQQEFKLDGLAWNFILCTPDKLKYPLLIDALIDILAITDICTAKINYTTICSVQYCFSLCWKLLLGLPPSTPHVEALMQEKIPNLHSLMWSIRCLHPINNSHGLIVNSLVKQGMYTASAEQLWKKITEHVSDTKYSIKQTTAGLDSFIKTFQIANPKLSKIITIDAIVSHLVAIYSTNGNCVKLGNDHGSKSSGSNTSSGANSSDSGSIAEISMTSTSGSDVSVIILSGKPDDAKAVAEKVTPTDEDMSKDLIVRLLDALEIVRECIFKTMTSTLSGSVQPHIFESLIALSGSKHPYWKDLAPKLTAMFTGQDKDIILGEWKKNLPILSEENISSSAFPVELHTLTVIDAHLGELSKHPSYSILLSVKHAAKSICNLIHKLLSVYKYDATIEDRIQSVLVPMLFDVRTEYLYDVSKQCLQTMINGNSDTDIFKALASPMVHILRVSYRLLIDSTELAAQGMPSTLDESVLQQILNSWETMLHEPMGINAMHTFFHETKQGSLVQVLLSFTNTSFSQGYATKVLQFFENLFKAAEKPDSPFKVAELCACIAELATVENVKLKNWLSHILLGPTSGFFSVSSVSSNVATPTNMATTSAAIPSISDQILPIDNDGMDIDYECTNAPVIDYPVSEPKTDECAERNGRLLQTLTKYIVSESRTAPNVSAALFQALIQLGQNLLCPTQEAPDFTDLLQVMITLADTSQGKGHSMLFSSSVDWLDISKSHILEKLNAEPKPAPAKTATSFENVSALLKYMVDLLQGLGYNGNRSVATAWEDETQAEFDDYLDDLVNEDDDSAVEDSDEDSLSNKLCTYSISQKDFINQHWYHCHTCKMTDKAGVCSVCARVCHKNHDISYAKYGNFFCDCGAKDDGSCQALNKRTSYQESSGMVGVGGMSINNLGNEHDYSSTIRRRTVTPPSRSHSMRDGHAYRGDMDRTPSSGTSKMTEMIESSRDSLKTSDKWKSVVKCLLDFFEYLMPAIQENCAKYSTVGCQLRAKNALERLHQPNKSFSISDQLMVATLGSQEGAFENVRMNYSGEQGQTIRQLLSTNLVRRVALCCLSSPHGKRQHLAVSHEKGKVTILQLSALLKQADAAKRKLTLSRLSSAPIPCIVLSLASNPANEDFLAVCGLKECHVLTFSNSGAVNDHIVLTPQLETANFIKRAIWLPGSQTKLALITADFVKIYELAEDTISPQYYFVVPSGKIRDCTFICQQDCYYMLLFASSGYIYTQPLADESLAKHGAFYITNTLDLDHPLIKDSNGLVNGGGVSIYYSHVLQMLFFSYSLGKSFMAPITDINDGVKCVIQLQTGPNSKNSSKIPPQALCQWTEIPGHPGLICAMMQTSNNPVIFMLRPDSVVMQEIKAQNSKAKIMDMVAIRHASSGMEKTTLLLLCEDGSLRIYSANAENTNYWLQSEVQPIGNQLYSPQMTKSSKKNKKSTGKTLSMGGKASSSSSTAASQGGAGGASGSSSSPATFPVDFFEHCNCLSDIEFGGNDLLQIYNTQQLKHRLNAPGLFVTSTRANGFTLEITNNDPNTVITGIRVAIGGQDPMRTPQSVTILGRTVNTIATKSRWFDIPMTREESLQSDKKLHIQFGPSADPDNICMLDSIKVYGKTKDVFGWPEESDDNATTIANPMSNAITNAGAADTANQITPLDKMMTAMLEVLDCGLALLGTGPAMLLDDSIRQKSMTVATKLLLHPLPNTVQLQAKAVLANLLATKQAYNQYKDKEILSEVHSELEKLKKVRDVRNIDPEAFYRLVLLTRNIAVARPQSLARIANENQFPIVASFMQLLHELHAITPTYEAQCSIVRVGLSHTESIVHAFVEIIYAFALSDPNLIDPMTKYFVKLLLNTSTVISYSVKQAMIKLLRIRIKRRKLVVASSPPICSTPTPSTSQQAIAPNFSTTAESSAAAEVARTSNTSGSLPASRSFNAEAAAAALNEEFAGIQDVDVVEPLGLEPAAGNAQVLASVEALLGGLRGFPQLLDMQPDGDEEAIMDIAIALSLQEQDGHLETLQQGLANIQGAGNRALQSLRALNVAAAGGGGAGGGGGSAGGSGGGSFNNEPAASIGSDDESNAATDGSTLRTPAEPAGSSESGGSGVDESIGNASGRSSTCDQMHSSPPRIQEMISQPEPSTSTANIQEEIREEDSEDNNEAELIHKLHVLRVSILQKMVENISILDGASGEQAIPFMQVILMLTSDLDGEQDSDQLVMQKLLTALIDRLEISPTSQPPELTTRSAKTEVKLVILRLLCVLMGKVKSSSKISTMSALMPNAQKDNATFVASTTANALLESGCIQFCLIMLKSFLPYWRKNAAHNDDGNGMSVLSPNGLMPSQPSAVTGASANLLKPRQYGPEPDMTPFFSPICLKGCADIFELYPTVLTEMSVRLPYQILKLSTNHAPSYEWYHTVCELLTFTLCEYMMIVQSAILRRLVRKLLLYVCGSKEKYRQIRDIHSLDSHIKIIQKSSEAATTQLSSVQQQQNANPMFTYDSLVELTEHLRACHEVATLRTGNWQRFCLTHVYVLPSLLRISTFQLDEGVSPIILQLLQSAVCNSNTSSSSSSSGGASGEVKSDNTKSVVMKVVRQDRERSEESECSTDSKFDPSQCAILVTQIFNQTSAQLLTKFIKIFLLETNITSIRWQAHALLYAFYENSNTAQKERLLNCMWELWSMLPAYGRRTAQFVDLLGYLTLSTKHINAKLPEYMGLAVSVLRQQNEFLSKHPNAPIYTALSHVLELDGYFLESEPCLVCNNPEVPMTNIKLSSIKIDSKFTTTTTIVKLVQSHTISKIILRIGDLKRTKMVRTINIYYNNRSVQAVVELKNRPSMWHKAKKVNLSSGQTDVKIEFPLPITACNLMIEYADFYETVTSSSENLQCPRCSAAVAANPGVCGNCGENVYQCHKCRAINYDEKDPFLCHSCGFSKYAKFDYSLYGRACCAVDPIESADDRAKTVQTINVSLEKADRIYRTLQGVKQILELLVQKVAEHKFDRVVDENMIGNIVTSSQVNKVIQLLAQKYCVESKTSFEELSKIIQKVQACRRELVAYDRSQIDSVVSAGGSDTQFENIVPHNRCYGCALASTEQCLTLLRAMAVNIECRKGLCKQGLVEELAQNNLRRGTTQIQDEVRNLLCLLTKELPEPTQNLCDLIHNRVKLALSGIIPLANIDTAVRHEMALLEALVSQNDSCWEQKLRVVLEIFLMACRDARGPPASILQPSLRILENLIAPKALASSAKQTSTAENAYIVRAPSDGLTVNAKKWLQGDKIHSFEVWKSKMPQAREKSADGGIHDGAQLGPQPTAEQKSLRSFISILEEKRRTDHHKYLSEKYGRIWRRKTLLKPFKPRDSKLAASWLQPILFNSNSRMARQLACALIPSLINKTHERKKEMLDLLTSFLKYIGEAGEASEEFLILYRCLAEDTPWREYLVLKGVLTHIADLLKIEIEKIHRLEETTLSSDLAQGYALRQLVELLAMFLDKPKIRQVYKGKLLGPVLQGYLSLRRLVVQRTRLVDDAQEKLLEMLEEMTTGTEEETRAFMSVLIDTVSNTPMNDIKTPVFIFERLCSIIHPEENDVGEFFLTLEKDPQQEDFLQGRMLGNPYPSTEAGLGPLMRDVKNKICTDCELVALLEDDNGMELLVQNKIISLDLPVKEVYKKVWLTEGGERDTMRIVYRMRGLLGDATEEFIETLSNKTTEEVDNEALYRMANVLADCGGLKVMLDRIGSLTNVTRSRQLLQVLLKLFLLAVKVRRCQEVLCQPELNAINTLLKVLQMCLQSENDSQQSAVTEQLLEIMETILSKAASDTLDSFLQFSLTFGGPEYVTALIFCTNCANVRNNPSVLRHLIRVLAALVYGNDLKMALLCEHFKDTLDFHRYDTEHIPEHEFKMELFCVLTNQIEHNSIGGTLKDYIMGLGIVESALEYITSNAPCVKPTLLRTDSDELKEFISKPSLKYILRFLTGLATKHEATQVAVSKDIIPIIHRLEQVSSDEHVGSLAENLLEALCTDPATAKRVQEVRDFTRAEKKRLAMATREKQLDALGMRTNEKGQVTAKGSILQKIEKLREETGLTCFICREGYACQPSKVLGIYTFTKRTNLEEFELKARKTLGYSTVTHFNVVHVDCHTSAIRLARGRDEWEMASLQNANTKCNGLLPLFGPDISEINFQNSISRHNAYMLESTQRCEISFANNMHDLKLLLMRFAFEKSFHEDAGGGGPQSNMHLIPYLLFYSIYTLLSSRSTHEKALATYLEQSVSERWLTSAYEVEGPLFQVTLSLALHTPTLWQRHRIQHLKRLLVIAQARHCSRNIACKALSGSDRLAKEYNIYKPYLMMWSMVDLVYTMFKTVSTPKPEDWPISLFDYIRRNDEAMVKSADSILETFTDEHLPCTSFGEFCDVAGLLNDIENPDEFLNELLQSLP